MYPVILAVKSQNTITSKVSKERYSFGPLNKFMPSQTNNVSVYQSPFILLYVKDRPFNFQVNALFVLSKEINAREYRRGNQKWIIQRKW
jgi:hypothetical protein